MLVPYPAVLNAARMTFCVCFKGFMVMLLGESMKLFGRNWGLSGIFGVILGGSGRHFNVIQFPHERRIYGWISAAMRRFCKFIEKLDLPLNGGNFTWC